MLRGRGGLVADDKATDKGGRDLEAAPTENVAPLTPEARAAAAALALDDAPRLTSGDTVGRLTVLENLGEGGFGIVLAAHDPALDRKVALKVLRTSLFGSARAEQTRDRLLREARAMAQLSHPNVVTVHDVGTIEGHVYIAMEYVDGGTLADWLERKPRSWRETIEVFLQAGRGLAAAHEAGFAHRDFKPANVLIDKKGRVRVCDFGLVSAGAGTNAGDRPESDSSTAPSLDVALTRTGELIGTPRYMAPEQHRGEPAGAEADQFAFCVALFEALYGAPPFSGGSYEELAGRVVRGEIDEPTNADGVPSWLRAIVSRGLRADRRDRYRSMDALLADLQRDPTVARRRLVGRLAAALVVGACVAVAAYALLRARSARNDPCESIAAKLSGVWDDDVESTVRAAFLATGQPGAQSSFDRVAAALDDYVRDWMVARRRVCRAASSSDSQSAQLAQLRAVCLSQRLDELRAVTELFATETSEVPMEKAVDGARMLEPVQFCMSSQGVPFVPPPADADRVAVRKLRKRLAMVQAYAMAGIWKRALAQAETVADEASEIGYAPLEAEALYWLGFVQSRQVGLAAAEKSLRRAARVADSGRHDVVAARAWTLLIQRVASTQGRFDEIPAMQEAAEAALERSGWDMRTHADLLSALGYAAQVRRDFDEALSYFTQARELVSSALGAEHPLCADMRRQTANILMLQGKLEESHSEQERVRAILEEAYGPQDSNVAYTESLLAAIEVRQGDLDSAIQHIERAIESNEKSFGRDHLYTLATRRFLADILQMKGQDSDALGIYLDVRKALIPSLEEVATDELVNSPRHQFGLSSASEVVYATNAAARLLASQGSHARARSLCADSTRFLRAQDHSRPSDQYTTYSEATCWAWAGDNDKTLSLVEEAVGDGRITSPETLASDWWPSALRSRPRWKALLRRLEQGTNHAP